MFDPLTQQLMNRKMGPTKTLGGMTMPSKPVSRPPIMGGGPSTLPQRPVMKPAIPLAPRRGIAPPPQPGFPNKLPPSLGIGAAGGAMTGAAGGQGGIGMGMGAPPPDLFGKSAVMPGAALGNAMDPYGMKPPMQGLLGAGQAGVPTGVAGAGDAIGGLMGGLQKTLPTGPPDKYQMMQNSLYNVGRANTPTAQLSPKFNRPVFDERTYE